MNLRWLWFGAALMFGIAIGLVYGWAINPVQYKDTTPDSLRSDYKADYVLAVAEAFQAENDSDLARTRLEVLNQPADEVVSEAVGFARQNQYAEADIALLERLLLALGSDLTPTANP